METGTFQSQHLHGDTETTQPSPPVSWKTLLDVAIPKGCGAATLSAVRAGFKSCTYGSKRSASAALTPASAKWARRFLAGDLLNIPPRRERSWVVLSEQDFCLPWHRLAFICRTPGAQSRPRFACRARRGWAFLRGAPHRTASTWRRTQIAEICSRMNPADHYWQHTNSINYLR